MKLFSLITALLMAMLFFVGQIKSNAQVQFDNGSIQMVIIKSPDSVTLGGPPAMWDTWFTYGDAINEINVYQEITNFYNLGVNQTFSGGFSIMLDAGVISTSLSPNGLLQINTNAFPDGYAGLVNCAHAHGMRIVQEFEPPQTNYSISLAGSMQLSLTNLYNDSTNFGRYGLDGFRIDDIDIGNFNYFYQAWKSVSTNKNLWVAIHSPKEFVGPSNLYLMPTNSAIMYELGGYDIIPTFYDVFHGTNIPPATVETFTGEGTNQLPGQALMPVWVFTSSSTWPVPQNCLNLACMFSEPLVFAADFFSGKKVTLNPDTLQVNNDALRMFPMVITNSSTNFDLIEKPMADGGCVLMLMSYNTNQNWTVTVPFSSLAGPLNIQSNEPVAVEDLDWNCGLNVIAGNPGTNDASMPTQFTWATNSVTLTSHLSGQADYTYIQNPVWPCLRLWKFAPGGAYTASGGKQ